MTPRHLTRNLRSRMVWNRFERFALTHNSALHGCLFILTRSGSGYYRRIED